MAIFAFEEKQVEQGVLPIAIKRALDALGLQLSHEGFSSLPLESRKELLAQGAAEDIDLQLVRKLLAEAKPAAHQNPKDLRPSHACQIEEIREFLGAARPLPEKVWEQLSSLARYALSTLCQQKDEDFIQSAYEELIGAQSLSTHLRAEGGVRMVSVSAKAPQQRHAVASSSVLMNRASFERLMHATAPKGDVLATARIAGIMATKKTAEIIPLCHPLNLTHAEIDFQLDEAQSAVQIRCSVTVIDRTGVEMEAMMGVSAAALTIYDMLKSIDRGMSIGPTELIEKRGGRSGTWRKGDDS